MFFYMKGAPAPARSGFRSCTIPRHSSGKSFDSDDPGSPALLGVINPGLHRPQPVVCPLRAWLDRPGLPALDLDRGPRGIRSTRCWRPPASSMKPFTLSDAALRQASGSRGYSLYAPIVRGPTQKQYDLAKVGWRHTLESRIPKLVTAVMYASPSGGLTRCWVTTTRSWRRTWPPSYSVAGTRGGGLRAGGKEGSKRHPLEISGWTTWPRGGNSWGTFWNRAAPGTGAVSGLGARCCESPAPYPFPR
jgi:hypothetical protein